MTRTFLNALCMACFFVAIDAHSDAARPAPWQPPAPINIKHDWIKLSSGEWLKGEIIALYNEELEFDSDELELLSLDWEDVDEVISYKPQSLRLLNGQIVEGRIHIKNDNLYIVENAQVKIPKNEIISIAHSKTRELDLWSADFTFSLNLRKGNTEEQQLGIDADIIRRTAASRFQTDYVRNHTVNTGTTQENDHRLTAGFDWFFHNKAFWRVVNYEYFRDPLQNIASRRTLSTSLGYQIYDTKKLEWSVTIGPGRQRTKFVSTQGGDSDIDKSPSGEFSSNFEWDITRDIEFELDYDLQTVDDASGRLLHHIKTGIDIDLTKRLDFSITLYLDSTAKPTADSDGTLPEKNDAHLLIGIGYEF